MGGHGSSLALHPEELSHEGASCHVPAAGQLPRDVTVMVMEK